MLMDRAQSSQNFQLLNYWDFGSKKIFSLRIIEKMNNFYFGIFFVNLLEKYVILVKWHDLLI